jgi:hypothetical protein
MPVSINGQVKKKLKLINTGKEWFLVELLSAILDNGKR